MSRPAPEAAAGAADMVAPEAVAPPAAMPPADGYPRPVVAWGLLAALFLAYILSFVDRMIIGLLVEPIKADLGISDTQVSLLVGLAFALFFTIAAIPLGRLVDRVHRPRAVAGGMAVWSGATMACGAAGSFATLFAARAVVGVGEAVLSPAAYSLIADSFPRRRLGLAMGIFGLGSALGAGLAFAIGGAVVALVSDAGSLELPFVGALRPWQAAFVFAGAPGLLMALLFLFLPEPRPVAARPASEAVPMRAVLARLRADAGVFWSLFLAVAAVNLSILGTVSWFPAMLMRGFALPPDQSGYLAGGLLVVGGLIGMIGGGAAMDRIGGGTPSARLRFCAVAIGIATVFAVAYPLVPSLALASITFVLFFTAAAAVTSAAPSVLQQLSPHGMRATVAAVYVFIVNIVGIGVGPTLTAMLSDTLFPGGDGIRRAMAIVAPAGYLVATALFAFAARNARRMEASTPA